MGPRLICLGVAGANIGVNKAAIWPFNSHPLYGYANGPTKSKGEPGYLNGSFFVSAIIPMLCDMARGKCMMIAWLEENA